ncbi:uncharacterized protein LOC110834110 [Zootermopsis nevadensis]|uniref:uncharacterized protein LOC110834110 n=1 Tax=Zootermopsis nevadensis TaxID=136037 RepID=UPI000B8E2AD5|nr:uncharacterized protein LOC110834110 [Zootermopsis nevadensis]XP_021928636.1 uncharacterized protein LOC110834110 [Zootermopsis nevadensis]
MGQLYRIGKSLAPDYQLIFKHETQSKWQVSHGNADGRTKKPETYHFSEHLNNTVLCRTPLQLILLSSYSELCTILLLQTPYYGRVLSTNGDGDGCYNDDDNNRNANF